jgi:hypothetical protein
VTALVPTVINGKRCLFLDMPGFNTVDFDNWDVFFRLMTALSVVQSYVEFRGVLYVDSLKDERLTPSAEKILTWLSLFCGMEYMSNVTIVVTKWDGRDEDGIAEKMAKFEQWKETLLGSMISKGAVVYHHGLTETGNNYKTLHIEKAASERRARARNFISTNYRGSTDIKLQIYNEIANGATIDTTQAGRWLKYGHDCSEDDGNNSSSNSETGQKSLWDKVDIKDIERWANLLFKASKFFMSTQASRPFEEWDSDPIFEDFEGPEFPFEGDLPIPNEGSTTCNIL